MRLFILKEVKPSTESKTIKLLTFDYLFPKQRLTMTMAVTFSRPNDVGSRGRTTLYLIFIVPTVILKLTSFAALYLPGYHVKVTRMLLKRKEGRRVGGREG